MNDTTRWIMIILLLLLIGAAVFMLLRKPGGDRTDESVDSVDRRQLDRDASDTSADAPRVETERSVYDQEAETAFDDGRGEEHDRATQAGGVGAAAGVAGAGHAASRTEDEPLVEETVVEEPTDPYQPDASAYEGGEPGTYAGESYRPTTDDYVGAESTDADDTTEGSGYAGTTYDPTGAEMSATAPVTGEPVRTTDEPFVDESAEPYQPAAGAYEGGEPGAYADDSHHTATDTDDSHLPTSEEEAATTTGTDDEELFDDGGREPVTESEDNRERSRQAAQIGALSATGVAAAASSPHDESGSEHVAADSSSADVLPLSDDQVREGARQEPLTVEEQEPHALDEQEPLTADDYLESTDDQPTTEYPVGETTYRSADGDATVVDDTTHDDEVAADGGAQEPFPESVYGPGSAMPAEDGTGPAGWEIKGNAGSMLFHTSESPSYDGVRAEVWFDSEESARAAGFAHWDRRRR
ncbi:hypothetical protein ACI3ET_10415 [Ornithinimicrobium sp. LYQ121]|uniref:sunset domain-containing protein n=1 Tax=Ornithinimicrobium sp. LYQ121 TaxID=3378801 RepID=UPI0038530F6F